MSIISSAVVLWSVASLAETGRVTNAETNTFVNFLKLSQKFNRFSPVKGICPAFLLAGSMVRSRSSDRNAIRSRAVSLRWLGDAKLSNIVRTEGPKACLQRKHHPQICWRMVVNRKISSLGQ